MPASHLLSEEKIDDLARILVKQIDHELFERKYAGTKEILKLVAAGAFLATAFAAPKAAGLFTTKLKNTRSREAWRRFNIPYLKRTLRRLEEQRLISLHIEDGIQTVTITENGRKRILSCALDSLAVTKPKTWDHQWYLVSYDIPMTESYAREKFVEYLKVWGFYPLQKSVYLHAYPCEKQIDFLREYLGVRAYVRLLTVTHIENDSLFRDFFGM